MMKVMISNGGEVDGNGMVIVIGMVMVMMKTDNGDTVDGYSDGDGDGGDEGDD